ncbi:hypothetical protein [Thioclava sp. IC9]|uniref:hypothetical protein n=1 Tax=Thioclava sp. IC9 TaxID=1973007 RepID=UPI000B5489E5|nr:hypothetical protein [Thioclava sp. IC9]OWX99274.1 hypothetical protein B6V76_17670 [Thioclava sp. IC9]
MHEQVIPHDEWNTSPPKLPRASKIELPPIHGVLPFDGVRSPSSRSAASQKVFLTYRTEADNWTPRIGICESAAEAAVAIELLFSPNIFDLKFQPAQVSYFDEEDGKHHKHTHDLLVEFRTGERRLIFVRNAASLKKPRTTRQIQLIAQASRKKRLAHDMVVANATDYTRQRRDNLFRMFLFASVPDPEADEIVLAVASRLKTLWHMQDIFPHVGIDQSRAFAACYRLVARKQLWANLDHVLWERSRIEVAS